jgi:uncharacterized membrane protein YtjA (UPF0391 family)
MAALVILFAILSVIFGVWGFGSASAAAWGGVQILFWIFLGLFILALLAWGGSFSSRQRPLP